MPSDDYTSAIGGGLKLKGSKPSGITKTKKKKKDKLKSVGEAGEASAASSSTEITKPESENATKSRKAEVSDDVEADELLSLEEEAYGGKTETERKHEEMKRKRLDERLQKTGIKTHKQRVEELNKYLSNLSEHHDMPRIGPG